MKFDIQTDLSIKICNLFITTQLLSVKMFASVDDSIKEIKLNIYTIFKSDQ